MTSSSWIVGACLALVPAAALAAPPVAPISLHPDNPRYFLFRDKPLVLITATEHYGSVINRPFDFEKYLDDAAERRMTLTRTFLLYRELQTPRNPSSPCKPESPDYIAPYPRTGPGKAADGEPIFDLNQWNPEFFERLQRFLKKASDRGVVVELTLFSHLYNDQMWSLCPLRAKNNKQGIGKGEWHEFDSLKDKALMERQAAFARKIVQETCAFDNIYYEICNEPAGGQAGLTPVADVDAWLVEMAHVVRDELRKHDRKHLVFGTQAFDVGKMTQELQATFPGKTWDAVNIHPHPYLVWQERKYPMGGFMTKELKLPAIRDFCHAAHGQEKPVVFDEDNAASLYRDEVGWTIHRKRAWTVVLSGAHYDTIDFSVTVGSEAGTAGSKKAIRKWFEHLSRFIHSFDFVHASLLSDWVSRKPEYLVCSALAVEGKDYIAYLADGRELTEAGAGGTIEGKVEFALPAGSFHVTLFSPTTGESSPPVMMEGGKTVSVVLPPFRDDIVIRATKVP